MVMQHDLIADHTGARYFGPAQSQFTSVFIGCTLVSKATEGLRKQSYFLEERMEVAMQAVQDGQCGLCAHFGETHAKNDVLVSIVKSHEADLKVLDDCGHPKHAALHLKVTPISGCDGFTPVAQA